ncbi:MAG: PP2C family protein-serine/threonine phosphatase, partial [Candidatus Zixiibacteriota bacterium]
LKLQRAVNELKILNEISTAISATLGVEEITHLIVQKCMKHLEAEQGALWLLDQENQGMARTFIRVMDREFDGLPFKIGVSLAGWVTKHRQPLIIDDFTSNKTFTGLAEEYRSIRGLIAVPLTIKNRIIGILCLFNKKGNGCFTVDDARLLSIVAIQSAQTIENARLYEEEFKLRELENDLKVARHIQKTLLPNKEPNLEKYDIAGLSVPARMVGGDYYDYIEINDRQMGLTIADVSGKGTAAALLMASLQTCIRGQTGLNQSARETIAKVNQMSFKFLETGRFVTLIYGLLDMNRAVLTYINAGHNYPILVKENGDVSLIEGSDLILGIDPLAVFEEKVININPGDVILLYTDGVTEATDARGVMYGERRLSELLSACRHASAFDISQKILNEVQTYQGMTGQTDDITLIVIKHTG